MTSLGNPYSTERLTFHAYRSPQDDDFFHAIQSDPISMINSCPSIPRPQDRRFSDAICRNLLDNSLLFVVICRKDHAAVPTISSSSERELQNDARDQGLVPIGTLFLGSLSPDMVQHRHSHLGIDILRSYQNQGYGSEAISWALRWAFRSAGLHRVELTVLGWNERASGLYRRLGFRVEGRKKEHLFKDGKWWDEIQMGILEDEWASKYAE